MMLTFTSGHTHDCEGYSRRDVLRVGALGLGGLTLPGLFAARDALAAEGGYVRDKAVVFLYLRGGPTQFETWDPKMSAPSEYRAMFGETKTVLPGVTFGRHFEKLATMADKMAIVRSFKVGSGGHGPGRDLITSGANPANASMGSIYSRLAGSTHPTSGMPTNALLTPRAVGARYASLRNTANEAMRTGTLSAEYKAFDPGAGGSGAIAKNKKNKKTPVKGGGLLADMQLHIPSDRLNDRRTLLRQINNLRHGIDNDGSVEGLDKYRQQAYDVILGGIADSFDISKEDKRTIERYDTSAFAPPSSALKKGTKNAKKIPEFSPVALGKQMLMARRLCEAGCGFVTVTSSGWDMHGNAFGVDDGMPCLGPAVDHAVSTFLTDLEERGLSDQVLLVISGEMGRTPKINTKGGRDHWANLCTLALAGGGLNMGQVIGASDDKGGSPATDPYTPKHLLSTIMHTLFDVGTLRIARGLPADITRFVSDGKPIKELV